MCWTRTLARRLATATTGLLALSFVLAFGCNSGRPTPSGPRELPAADAVTAAAPSEAKPVPLFATTEPAKNAPSLVLMPGDRGVLHGWVAGGQSFAGQTVVVRADRQAISLTVRDDNTFTWTRGLHEPMEGGQPVPVTVTLEVPNGKPLVARTVLQPTLGEPGPCVFFVTDRSAYRPGHTLKFVAFLRTLLPSGEFEPVRDKDVTVDLTSEAKGTRATRLELHSDSFGRVSGTYTFSEADSLDHYTLTASGFTGGGRVLLGEYRKTKVGLKITGEVKDGKLVLTFDAKDYLDRSVKGTSATFSASVVRSADPAKLTLDPAKFAHPEAGPPSPDDFATLPDDERLLTLANGVSAMTFMGYGAQTLATREGTVSFPADGPGKVELDLNPEWLKGSHTVTVNGVMLDEMGRENRTATTIELNAKPTRGVKVSTPREMVGAGEKIPVRVEPFGFTEKDAPQTTLLVVKLEHQASIPMFPQLLDPDGESVPDNTRLPAIDLPKPTKKPNPTGAWQSEPVFDPVKRTIVTVLTVTNGQADADLKQPGAYKLLAITRLADGTTLQSETGVVVKSPAKLPGVVLKLDAREIEAGSRLKGTVHTRFAGAKLLLSLRDSTGIRLLKPLTAGPDGVVRFDEALPANLRYGCAVCVQYPESPSLVHADQADLFVIPTDRTIKITTKVPEKAGPGEEIKLDITIDRQEEVDLIVSVYDESLLSVTADLGGNVKDYYLADGRGQARAGRELAATRMGSVTVAELVAKAEKLLKQTELMEREPGLKRQLEQLSADWAAGNLTRADMVTLVQLAGFEVYLGGSFHHANQMYPVGRNDRLADLFRRPTLEAPLSAIVIGNVVMLAMPDQGNGSDPWAAFRPGYFPYYGQFGNLGQFGSLGGQFGIAGYGLGFGEYGAFGNHNSGRIHYGRPYYNGTFASGNSVFSYPGGNMGFSQLGGQFGMSYAYNRDFVRPGGAPALQPAGPAPALGMANEAVRRDFADSAYWNAQLRTDKTGHATATFKLPDSLTGWRVVVTAVSPKMHAGTAATKFRSTRELMIWPMLPRAFVEGDTVSVFGLAVNLTDKEQTVRVHLKTENGEVIGDTEKTVKAPANGYVPVYWTFKPGTAGMTDLLMSVKGEAGEDASLKRLPVVRSTVEERATASGLVGKGDLKFTLPPGFEPTNATVTVTVAPTLAADMADTLPYLVEYPYGCVEQTMSRFLPAIRVALITQQLGGSTNPELEKKLPKVVEAGVKRLLDLQQPDGGWAWQGNGATHEMMTPYALYGLLEAEKAGYPIPNEQAVQRGLARLRQYLEQMKPAWQAIENPGPQPEGFAPTQINDSLYCLYVLSLREPVPDDWWGRIERGTGDPLMSDYGHALALEMAVKAGKKELAAKLAAELRKRARRSGDWVFWTSARFSRWPDNTFEVTAACFKALVAFDPHDPLIPGVLAFFISTKRGDRWDSTKDTAVILYALCDYLAAVRDERALSGAKMRGTVMLAVNGGEPRELKLDGPLSKAVTLSAKDLKPGENTLRVTSADASGTLARVVVRFHRGGTADIPARNNGVKVTRTISVRTPEGKWKELKSGEAVPKGSYVKVSVTGTPGDGAALSYTLLESPKPACGETLPQDDRRPVNDIGSYGHVLREDREALSAFHFEGSRAEVAGEYVFLTEFTGEFRLPPARVERMYNPASTGHSESFVLKVTEK